MIESDDRARQDDRAEKGSPADSSEKDSAKRKTRDWKAVIEEEEAKLRARAEEDDDPLGPGPETALYLQ